MKKIISLLLVILTLFSFVGCKTELQGGQPDAQIISNGGIVIKQGDWIYYINGAMPLLASEALADSPRAKIYRAKADGTEKQAVTDKKAFNMYIYKDKIFYTSPTENDVVLYVININGKNNKKLKTINDTEFVGYGKNGVVVENDNKLFYYDYETLKEYSFDTGVVDSAEISDNYIYYCADSVMGLKRIEIETGRQETLCDNVGLILYATDDQVYFMSTRIPYSLNTNTLELTQISEALYRKAHLDLNKRYLVCVLSETEDEGIFLQPIDNKAGVQVGEGGNMPRLQVHTKSASAITTTNEYIFFVEEETGDVYRMTFDGNNKTVLGNVPSVYNTHTIEVIDDTLYILGGADSGKIYSVKIDGSEALAIIKE